MRPTDTTEVPAVSGYRLIAPLPSRARAGAVWDAVEEATGAKVELQLIGSGEDSAFAERFIADARRLAKLGGPGLPVVRGVGDAGKSVYMAIEADGGSTVRQRIGQGWSPNPWWAVRVLAEVAEGLDASHAAGLLHRRVSPDTIVIAESMLERATLVDLALGALPTEPVAGSDAPYRAPESTAGEPARPAGDIYSFACVLYECLTGRAPLEASPAAGAAGTGIGEDVARILQQGMARDPAARPASARDLVTAIDHALARGALDGEQAAPKAVPAAAPAPRETSPVPQAIQPRPPRDPVDEEEVRSREPVRAKVVPTWPLPEQRPPSRSRFVGWPAGVAVGIIAAALVGYVVGNRDNGHQGRNASTAASSAFELSLPAGWREAPARPVAGLRLAHQVAAEAKGGAGRLLAGLSGRSSFPARVAQTIDSSPGTPALVRLSEFDAYRWRGLRERRTGRPLTLFVATTDAGLLAVACVADRPPELPACQRAASSLSAADAQPLSARALALYADRVDRLLRKLGRRRVEGARRLRRAGTPGGQASAASGLARAYSSAATRLASVPSPRPASPAKTAAVSSLRRVAAAYQRLSRAVRRRGRSNYLRARRSAIRAESGLRSAIARL